MKMLATAAVCLLVLGNSAQAEPGEIENWLMDQPMTLWDRGMDKLEREVKRSYDPFDPNDKGTTLGYVSYDWDRNQIVIGYFIYGSESSDLTHDTCNEIRREKMLLVLGMAVVDYDQNSFFSEERTLQKLYRVIGDMFSHQGFVSGDRDDELGRKLAERTQMLVSMHDSDNSGIICKDAVTSLEAPSKPTSR